MWGAATASLALMPPSIMSIRDCATKSMIAGPPGEPVAMANLPSGPNTMVGDIALMGRLPGAGALATGLPSRTGSKEKSVSSLFRKNPLAMISEPKTNSTVMVIETTSP